MSETLRRQLQEQQWAHAARTALALLRDYPRGLLGPAPGSRGSGRLSSVAAL